MDEALETRRHDVGPPAEVAAPTARTWRTEPTAREVLALTVLAWVVGFVVINAIEPFWDRVRVFGDSPFYVDIARAIRNWDFSRISPWHFWGLPYLIAGVSLATTLSEWWSLLIVSVGSALGAVYLVHRLWGGWVAGYFLVLSVEWHQRMLLGGAEPLFVLLVLASFTAARRERWALGALLAALATIVRPVGLFLLISIGIVLLVRKEYRRLVEATAIGLLVGVVYVLPHVIYYGDPLANLRFYQSNDWAGGSPFGVPFVPIIQGALSFDVPWTTRIREGFWVVFYVVAAVVMLRRPQFRAYARRYPVEVLFTALAMLFAFSYNSPVWAWLEFARYSLPAFPVALFALEAYLPRDRRVVWALAPLCASLSAVSAMNARRVLSILRRLL